MKIPFDIKYKDDILAGKVKVQTAGEDDVRIVSFDETTEYPVVGVISKGAEECVECWTAAGRCVTWRETESDLVIIKSE